MEAPLTLADITARLSRFFTLTKASLYWNRVAIEDNATLLINRELAAAIGPLEENGLLQRGHRRIL